MTDDADPPRPDETREERRRRLARERQARKRARDGRGDLPMVLPADVADELGDDAVARAIEILRQRVKRTLIA